MMNYTKKVKAIKFTLPIIFTLGAQLLTLTYAPGQVVAADMFVTEFRQLLLDYDSALNSCGKIDGSILQKQIGEMTDEQLDSLLSAVPDQDEFIQAISSVINSCTSDIEVNDQYSIQASTSSALLVGTSFTPDYPSGSSGYDVFIATLPGLGLLDNGKTNRTDANAVGQAWIALEAFRVYAIIAQGVCDAAPSGDLVVINSGLCPPAAVAWELVQATQIVIDQTAYQDSLIDGAEIEAAYENSKILIQNTVDISSDLSQHDLDIKNQVNLHDTEIKAQLNQHDIDIKARLDVINGKIEVLMARQLEVIRLLHTPQGRRGTDVPACDDGPCDWTNK